jgi:hypothetical protein
MLVDTKLSQQISAGNDEKRVEYNSWQRLWYEIGATE